MGLQLFNFFRQLSFGGLIGALISGLIFFALRPILAPELDLSFMLIFGGFFGMSASQWIDSYLINGMLRPFARYVKHWTMMADLAAHRRANLVGPKMYAEIQKRLVEEHFLKRGDQVVLGLPMPALRPSPEFDEQAPAQRSVVIGNE